MSNQFQFESDQNLYTMMMMMITIITLAYGNLDSTRINEDVDKCSNADNLLKPIKRKPISSVQMVRHQFCTM